MHPNLIPITTMIGALSSSTKSAIKVFSPNGTKYPPAPSIKR